MQLSNELFSLTRRDPLAFGISYIDLLESRKWEISSRQWIVEPYQTLNPWMIEKYPVGQARRMTFMKSTQAGISTLGLVKMFHFTTNWPVRVFYTLPRQQDTIDMVGTRVDPMINNSPFLKDKKGLPDSTHAKRIGDSYIFFMELSVEPRMQPADMLIVDEVDLSDPIYMSTAQNRLDASRWKLQLFLSTPTVSNWGIHNLYMHSDQRQWMIKCSKCGHYQTMDWEQNIRVIGNPSNPDRVYYGCTKCDAEITVEHMQTGNWVAQKPSMSSEHVGYHISQMVTTPAPVLWNFWRDPQTKTIEFYRKRLGMPYEVGGGSVSREDFLVNSFTETYSEEFSREDTSCGYYMGVDQGNELQVLVGKVHKDNPEVIKIVHAELVEPIAPNNSDASDYGFARIGKLMHLYQIKRCVIDGDPNRHDAIALQREFPGRVVVADYAEHKEDVKRKIDRTGTTTNLTINRTTGFDGVLESIKDGKIKLYGSATRISQEIEIVIDQITALKRDVEIRKTRSGEIEVAVYRKVRADHFAHVLLYLQNAVKLDKSGGGKVAIVNLEPEEEPEDNTSLHAGAEIVRGIVYSLAEVPKQQIEDYLIHWDDPGYVPPFPLSYKLKIVQNEYTHEDILWVMENQLI